MRPRGEFSNTVQLPPESSDHCMVRHRVYEDCVSITNGILPPDYHQPICNDFENRWIQKYGHTDNLISVGSNTLHNLLRLPWEPGMSRPELFAHYAGMFQVVDPERNCTAECSTTKVLTQTRPFPISEYAFQYRPFCLRIFYFKIFLK